MVSEERLALARVDLRGGRLAPEPGPPEDAFHHEVRGVGGAPQAPQEPDAVWGQVNRTGVRRKPVCVRIKPVYSPELHGAGPTSRDYPNGTTAFAGSAGETLQHCLLPFLCSPLKFASGVNPLRPEVVSQRREVFSQQSCHG